MKTQDIWNTIKSLFFKSNDKKPLKLQNSCATCKEAVAEHRIDDIRGARKLQTMS